MLNRSEAMLKDGDDEIQSIEIGTNAAMEILAFSPSENHLALADVAMQVDVFAVGSVYTNGGMVQLLHRFQLHSQVNACTFNADGSCLAVAGKDKIIRTWEVTSEACPTPYEVPLEWYLSHYVKQTHHLIYRQDYSHMAPVKGNTVLHRLIEEGTLEMLKEYVPKHSELLPVQNENGETPLDMAVKLRHRGKTAYLLDIMSANMTPLIAQLPVWSRLMGANLGPHKEVALTDLHEMEGDLSNVQCRNGRYFITDKDPFFETMVYQFPDLCVLLLERSLIKVSAHTIDEGISRLHVESYLKKPAQEFLPARPLWKRSDGHSGKEVEVDAYITGCTDFITYNGSFKTLVRMGNPRIFETAAMRRAIEFKWETYGLYVQNATTLLYVAMVSFFISALYYEGDVSSDARTKHSALMSCSSLVSLFILWKEYRDWRGDTKYFTRWSNIMDNGVIALVWMLTAWSFVTLTSSTPVAEDAEDPLSYSDDEDVGKRLVIAASIFLMLLNFLVYLSCYSFIGAVLYIFVEVVVDFLPILVVMILFLVAYVIALRIVLADGSSEIDPFEGDFTRNRHWSDYSHMVNIAFNFGFVGAIDESYLEPYDLEDGHRVPLHICAELLFYMYAIVSNVILLNLLIAVMGDSFDRVKVRGKPSTKHAIGVTCV
jgi:hypothetical protein